MKKISILTTPECNDIVPSLLSKKALSLYLEKHCKNCNQVSFIKSSYIWKQNIHKKNYKNWKDSVFYTEDLQSKESLKLLNNNSDIFLLGPENVLDNQYAYFQHILFDFVNDTKIKLAYALSLNNKYIFYGKYKHFLSKLLLSRFNNVSVRDKKSQLILEQLGIKSTIVLDPIFLLDEHDFDIEHSNVSLNSNDKKFYYIIDSSLEKSLSCQNENYKKIENDYSYADLLKTIKQSQLVITDSYCIIYLAIFLKIPFIFVVIEGTKREQRAWSFFELLNIDKNKTVFIKKDKKEDIDNLLENTIILNEAQNNLLAFYISQSKSFLKTLENNSKKQLYIADNRNLILSELSNLYNKTNFIEDKRIFKSKNVAILTLSYCAFNNYGNVLVSFALQSVIEKLGYKVGIISYSHFSFNDVNKNPKTLKEQQFYKINCEILKYYTKEDNESYDDYFSKLNKEFDTFVLCSDVLWLPTSNSFGDHYYYLSFVDNNNKKFSYSPSTASTIDIFDTDELKIINTISGLYLHRFTNIGVRENSGVSIIKKISGLDANWLLDPVFLLSKEDWINFINSHEHWNIKHDLFCYITRSIHIDGLTNIGTNDISIFDWLYSIMNAKIVISTSFHATCFAIIFNKPFILIAEQNVINNEKLKSLFELFDLPYEKILNIKSNTNITKEEILKNVIDSYQNQTNQIMQKWRDKSINYLAESLRDNKGNKLSSISYDKTFNKLINEFSNYLSWIQN